MGAVLFLIGAVVTVSGILLPHSPHSHEGGYLALAAAMAVLGGLLLALPRRLTPFAPPVAIVCGIAAATTGLLLNGEDRGGAAVLNEFFYLWPVLYSGYFFAARWTALVIATTGVVYVAALQHIGVTGGVLFERVFVVVSVIAGTGLAMWSLRRHVDRLVRRLHDLARRDPLTHLLNRRAFDERLHEEFARTHRTKEPFALVLADIDHFKAINDRHGHAAGDEALIAVADTFKGLSRAVDTVARIGGEEFALLLPGTTIEGAIETAERLREAVARRTGRLTASFGVVQAGAHGHTADDLLRAADRALYTAKAAGRDRTVAPDGTTVAAA